MTTRYLHWIAQSCCVAAAGLDSGLDIFLTYLPFTVMKTLAKEVENVGVCVSRIGYCGRS